MKETLELCEKAAKEIPNVRYIGWDIAITENGPEIIEVNSYPCYTNYQYYLMHDDGVKMNYLEQVKDIEFVNQSCKYAANERSYDKYPNVFECVTAYEKSGSEASGRVN